MHFCNTLTVASGTCYDQDVSCNVYFSVLTAMVWYLYIWGRGISLSTLRHDLSWCFSSLVCGQL